MVRMSDELKIRRESSKRERELRDNLKRGCEKALHGHRRMQSVLYDRDKQIGNLEREVEETKGQLEAVRRAELNKPRIDVRSVGTQLNGVADLETRIERLTEVLLTEKKRNQRIKHLIHYNEKLEAVIPPLPVKRAVSTPPIRRRQMTTESCASTRIAKAMPAPPSLSGEQFLVINSRPLLSAACNRSAQTLAQPVDASWLRADSPGTLLSPIRKVNTSFTIFEDKQGQPSLTPHGMYGVLVDRNTQNEFRNHFRQKPTIFQEFDISSPKSYEEDSRQERDVVRVENNEGFKENRRVDVRAEKRQDVRLENIRSVMRQEMREEHLAKPVSPPIKPPTPPNPPTHPIKLTSPIKTASPVKPSSPIKLPSPVYRRPTSPLTGLAVGELRIEASRHSPSPPVSPRRHSPSPPLVIPPLNLQRMSGRPPVRPALLQTDTLPPSGRSHVSVLNYSSEEAIKRAVTAAINKRKKIAAMGVSLGSARSELMSSSSLAATSPTSSHKARFGCI